MSRDILRKVIPIIAVIIALSIVGFGIVTEFSPSSSPSQPNISTVATHVPTPTEENKPPFTVQRGDVTREITFTGQISSAAKQELFFHTHGPVDKILVKVNDRVKSGQLLANLYLNQIQFDLKRAQITLDIDKLNLALAQVPSPYDNPNLKPINLAIRQKQIDLAQLDVDNTNATIADMEIFAPSDGTVTAIFFKEGDQTIGFEPVIEIADLSNLEVAASAVGEDFNGLAINTAVTMQSSTNPNKVLTGVITALPAAISANSSTNTNGDEFIHIALKQDPLAAGYQYGDQLQISAVAEKRKNVLWLPPNAITTNSSHSYVNVQDSQGQHQVEIKVGLTTDSQVEILSGLKQGQGVYSPY